MSSLQATMNKNDMIKMNNDFNRYARNGLNYVVDSIAKDMKENTLSYGAAIAGAVKGGVQGYANKEGTANLNFNSQAVLKANKDAIMNGAKNAGKGIIAGGTANALFNIESVFDKTPVGKAIDKAIDKGAGVVKKAINFLFGGGSK